MNAAVRIGSLRRAASRRRSAIDIACVVPPALALVALAARIGGTTAAVLGACVLAGGVVAWLRARVRAIDEPWVARRLDASLPGMDDSAALLLREESNIGFLQRLQRARLQTRLAAADVDLRAPWPRRRLAAAWTATAAIVLVAAVWPPRSLISPASAPPAREAADAVTALTRAAIAIAPPAYTGLPAREEPSLDAKAPAGAALAWHLRFDTQPRAVVLKFHDDSSLALRREGDEWSGTRVLASSLLYRVVLDGAAPLADDRLHRIDAIADLPPDVRVVHPEKTLTLLDAQQKTWELAFEASDDYGIARAELGVTLAQGSGENITFKEQTIELHGDEATANASHEASVPTSAARTQAVAPGARAQDASAPPRTARYTHVLDLAQLGIAQGDDVVVRLAVTDNREPNANVTRSASFILRWPADASSETAGMDGIVQRTMPAYFRSQRQIIIDTEALVAEQPTLDAARFAARSDALGVDQKILRLRYGQFLGEEAEGRSGHAESERVEAASAAARKDAGGEPAATQADALHAAQEAHEHAQAPTDARKFGEAGDVVAEFGHVHDEAEAATLLDPDTKAILKSALAEMWQAELDLRQAKPADALPYERRALDFIKQVQQSTRIYLARVGFELPVPDEARRLTGERKGVTDRVGTLVAASVDGAPLAQLWTRLQSGDAPDWQAAEGWLRAHERRLPDALGVLAAIDRVRREPACTDCRSKLMDALWPLLPTPAAASAPRAQLDAAQRAYLDALQTVDAK